MERQKNNPDAVAHIRGGSENPSIRGLVRFYQEAGRVLLVAEMSGLSQRTDSGFLALHIHEGGSCEGSGFPETGGHYNPGEMPHPRHAGDLPPLLLCGGGAFLAVRTDRFRVSDVIGKTVVIHSGPDDFRSQPAGNAGSKIACGVIERKQGYRRCCPGYR